VTHGLVDADVDAEGQAVTGRGDLVEHGIEPVGLPVHDMEDRAEPLHPEAAVGWLRVASGSRFHHSLN
jgi:hypothetical protein